MTDQQIDCRGPDARARQRAASDRQPTSTRQRVNQSDPPASTRAACAGRHQGCNACPCRSGDDAGPGRYADRRDVLHRATPALAPADAAIAEKLRDLANGKFDRIVGGKKERGGRRVLFRPRLRAALGHQRRGQRRAPSRRSTYLAGVDADGLDPADYPVPNFKAGSDPAALAEAELQLTNPCSRSRAMRRSAACTGRASAPTSSTTRRRRSPPTCWPTWSAPRTSARRSTASSRRTRGYKALKAKLAEVRGNQGEPATARIAGRRRRSRSACRTRACRSCASGSASAGDGNAYDKALADAVKKFQQQHKTQRDRHADHRDRRRAQRQAPRSRRRHHHRQHGALALGAARPRQDLCDGQHSRTSRCSVMHNGQQSGPPGSWSASRGMPTPILSAEMKYITVNPTWNVPPSIVANEYLPALQQDPTVLERMGLQGHAQPGRHRCTSRSRRATATRSAASASTSRTSSWSISTTRRTSTCSRTTSAPTATAACGSRIRPSTPRCCSRSCVPDDELHRGAAAQDVRHHRDRHPLPDPIPVHLTYQTAFVDDAGKLQIRDDIYGRDARSSPS